MKYGFICMLAMLTACDQLKKDDDLTGVYITSYQNEFYTGEDTLLVSKANNGKDMYSIERHTSVSKVDASETKSAEIVTVNWTLEYDPKKQTLFELKQGKTLVWNDVDKTLQLGNRRYKKAA